MEINWLVESDAFDEGSSDGVVKALDECGIPYKIFKTIDFFSNSFQHFEPGEHVFFYGSVQAAKAIQEVDVWWPGVIAHFPNYRCSVFGPKLGDKMLSSEHFFAPLNELERLWPFFERCFDSTSLFLRPDEGDKLFAGQVVEDYKRFFQKESVYLTNSDAMCFIANAFNIEAEYRLVIVDDEVVTGSQYRLNGRQIRSPHVPDDVVQFANDILATGFAPDAAFILDVCRSNGNLFCLEVNAINCAGLYACDPTIFVQSITKMLESAYYNGISEFN